MDLQSAHSRKGEPPRLNPTSDHHHIFNRETHSEQLEVKNHFGVQYKDQCFVSDEISSQNERPPSIQQTLQGKIGDSAFDLSREHCGPKEQEYPQKKVENNFQQVQEAWMNDQIEIQVQKRLKEISVQFEEAEKKYKEKIQSLEKKCEWLERQSKELPELKKEIELKNQRLSELRKQSVFQLSKLNHDLEETKKIIDRAKNREFDLNDKLYLLRQANSKLEAKRSASPHEGEKMKQNYEWLYGTFEEWFNKVLRDQGISIVIPNVKGASESGNFEQE